MWARAQLQALVSLGGSGSLGLTQAHRVFRVFSELSVHFHSGTGIQLVLDVQSKPRTLAQGPGWLRHFDCLSEPYKAEFP